MKRKFKRSNRINVDDPWLLSATVATRTGVLGWLLPRPRTVVIAANCPRCLPAGHSRAMPRLRGWVNPCGHRDDPIAVLAEADELERARDVYRQMAAARISHPPKPLVSALRRAPAAPTDPPGFCCGAPLAKIPGRDVDIAIGIEHLAHCRECGHYEPWDADTDSELFDG
ncbi:hypothetical protein ACQP0C_41710 (plasmid) [Nocardia sp. CA-129566]|uniref:hypothetical protein n=1 Tax=Nocardia sp. CA-129566 TaxID=3239976 RepID=UPI003D99FE31